MAARFLFLGSGSAQGLPYPGCLCPTCASARRDPRQRRARSAAVVKTPGGSLVLDLGLGTKEKLKAYDLAVDALAVTHLHLDHTFDLWQWRLIAPGMPAVIPVDGFGRQILELLCGSEILPAEPFSPVGPLADLHLTPLPLNHTCRAVGYRVDGPGFHLAYLTDTCGLPSSTHDFLSRGPDLDLLVVEATYPKANGRRNGHNDIEMALKLISELRPSRSALTHLGHQHVPHDQLVEQVHKAARRFDAGDVLVARDGLTVDLH